MVTAIIFSKDRACQLDLLLRSLRENSSLNWNPHVLYDYSSEDFKDGYDKLILEYPNVSFIKQISFKGDLTAILGECEEYIAFFTDDDVLYRGCDLNIQDIRKLFEKHNPISLSLRLGCNTIIQDPYTGEKSYTPHNKTSFAGKFIVWDIKHVHNYNIVEINGQQGKYYHACNFTMPVSLDGHIYKKKTLVPLLVNLEYYTPNMLELAMCKQPISNYNNTTMSSLHHSCVVNSPNNKVQTESETNFGERFPMSCELMNQKYLEGYYINLEKIYEEKIIGCHQELPMELIKK